MASIGVCWLSTTEFFVSSSSSCAFAWNTNATAFASISRGINTLLTAETCPSSTAFVPIPAIIGAVRYRRLNWPQISLPIPRRYNSWKLMATRDISVHTQHNGISVSFFFLFTRIVQMHINLLNSSPRLANKSPNRFLAGGTKML